MTDTTDRAARLAEIRARVDAATPGDWKLDDAESWDIVVWGPPRTEDGTYGKAGSDHLLFNVGEDVVRVGSPCGDKHVADGQFIAHARTDVPFLLDLIEESDIWCELKHAIICPRCGSSEVASVATDDSPIYECLMCNALLGVALLAKQPKPDSAT